MDRFKSEIREEFLVYCQKKGINPNKDAMVNFLTSHNFINETTMKRFVILRQYDKLLNEDNLNRSQSIQSLASEFRMDESSIRNIIKNHSLDFIGG